MFLIHLKASGTKPVGKTPHSILNGCLGTTLPPHPALHTLSCLILLEGDVHQPLIKFLDPPEVIDHFYGGRVVLTCAVQSCLQSQQLRGEEQKHTLQSEGQPPCLTSRRRRLPAPTFRALWATQQQESQRTAPLPCRHLGDWPWGELACLPTSQAWGKVNAVSFRLCLKSACR